MRLLLIVLVSSACATASPEPTASSLTAPRCQPACVAPKRCFQLTPQPGGPWLPPVCI